MPNERRRMPAWWGSLILMALLAGGVWRAEVEYHGWEGATWLGYFHWAVPIGVGMFIAWVLVANRQLSALRLTKLGAALLLVTTIFHEAVAFSFFFTYGGPKAFFYLVMQSDSWVPWDRIVQHAWILRFIWWWPLAPLAYLGLARMVGLRPGWRRFVISEGLYLLAVPCSVLLVALTLRCGDVAFISIIKTGYTIPFVVVALGVLFLPRCRTEVQDRLKEEMS